MHKVFTLEVFEIPYGSKSDVGQRARLPLAPGSKTKTRHIFSSLYDYHIVITHAQHPQRPRASTVTEDLLKKIRTKLSSVVLLLCLVRIFMNKSL